MKKVFAWTKFSLAKKKFWSKKYFWSEKKMLVQNNVWKGRQLGGVKDLKVLLRSHREGRGKEIPPYRGAIGVGGGILQHSTITTWHPTTQCLKDSGSQRRGRVQADIRKYNSTDITLRTRKLQNLPTFINSEKDCGLGEETQCMSTEIKDDEEDISNIKEYFGISEEEIICQENTAGEVRKLENMILRRIFPFSVNVTWACLTGPWQEII